MAAVILAEARRLPSSASIPTFQRRPQWPDGRRQPYQKLASSIEQLDSIARGEFLKLLLNFLKVRHGRANTRHGRNLIISDGSLCLIGHKVTQICVGKRKCLSSNHDLIMDDMVNRWRPTKLLSSPVFIGHFHSGFDNGR